MGRVGKALRDRFPAMAGFAAATLLTGWSYPFAKDGPRLLFLILFTVAGSMFILSADLSMLAIDTSFVVAERFDEEGTDKGAR